MKAFAFWSQMSPRERQLIMLLGLVGFVLVNVMLGFYFMRQRTALMTELAAVQGQIDFADAEISQRPTWETRGNWLAEHQRELTNEGRASAELLDRVKAVAQAQQVIPEKPLIQPKRIFDRHQTVSVGVETSSDWASLVKFMYYLQEPKEAVVFEKILLSTDPQDSDKVKGNFTISQYYAP